MKNTIRIIGFLILASMLVAITCIPSRADLDTTLHSAFCTLHSQSRTLHSALCTLHFSSVSDGILELTISLSSPRGVCAMLCEITYNPQSLLLLSCGTPCEDLNLSFADFDGSLRLLLDSTKNSPPECELVHVYFKRIGNGATNLNLTCLDALYLDGNSGPVATSVTVTANLPPCEQGNNTTLTPPNEQGNTAAPAPPNEQGNTATPATAPNLTHFSAQDGKITFTVAANKDCFAAGARLFLVDLESGEITDVTVAGVVGRDGIFTARYPLDEEKSYSVVVTALAFCGLNCSSGEKTTALIPRQH